MVDVQAIDRAAGGFIRHRFVRALCASWAVLAVFLILALSVGGTVHTVQQPGQQAWAAPVALPFLVALFLAPVVLGVALAGALIELVHRRLVALAVLIVAALALAFSAAAALTGPMALFRAIPSSNSVPPAVFGGAMIALGVFGALISYECLRQAWWQLTVDADAFRAARGWRPSPWRLFTTFRRHLGLPSFIAQIGRGRIGLTLLYFAVAVLNVGLVAMLLLPLFMMSGERDGAPNPMALPSIVALAILLGLNVLGAGALFARLADGRATKIYQGVREWDGRPPVVFLRTFDQDDERVKAAIRDPFAKWPAGVGRPRTLDEILLEHASPYGPVIAIGDPRDPTPPLGAARVFVPGEGNGWRDVVSGLVGASKAVVMCPNDTEGVKWELDLIAQAQGRVQAIFLANPELPRERTAALFAALAPAGTAPEIGADAFPIAAFADPKRGWRVLTAKRLGLESYTAALNTALQALFGAGGTPIVRPKRDPRGPSQIGNA